MAPHRRIVGLLLFGAITLEVCGTLLLRASDGFRHIGAAVGCLLLYGVSTWLFGRALERGMRLGVGYGTLTSCGLAAATLASVVLFGDAVTAVQLIGIAVIGVGAVLLQTGSPGRSTGERAT